MSASNNVQRPLPLWISAAAGPLAIAIAFLSLLSWSWLKWTDVQVDFGLELYVPWQLHEGQALYRDIESRNGPLSHYVNALWFACFGVSLRTLVFANLGILALLCAMMWKIFRDSCDRVAASVAPLVLLGMFAFSQYTTLANYNYVTPYQHAQTHGLVLTVAMILLLSRALATQRARGFAAAGLCLGLVFLTKVELVLPAAATGATAVALLLRDRRIRARALSLFVTALLAPGLLMTAFLAVQMPLAIAWRGVRGNFVHLGTELARDPFYLRTMGMDDPLPNLAIAASAFLVIVGFGGAAVALDAIVPTRRHSNAIAAALGAAGFALLLALPVGWTVLARALPLCSVAVLLALLWAHVAHARRVAAPEAGTETSNAPPEAGLLLWAVFSTTLLGKVLLHARFGHYGFALAMPATVLLAVSLTSLLPRQLERWKGDKGKITRALGLAAVAACTVWFLHASNSHYAVKTLGVGAGSDRILAEAPPYGRRALIITEGLEKLEALVPADATLLVWPEGIGLNYWLRRPNPTRFNLFLPSELEAFGAVAMLASVKEKPPDWVVLLHRDAVDFGVARFGETESTGRAFLDFFEQHYQRVETIGAEPFAGRAPGLAILRRTDS